MSQNTMLYEDIKTTIKNNEILLRNFRNKSVLITGVTGLIAHVLVLTFLEANKQLDLNIKVIGLARNKRKCEILYADFLNNDDLNFIYQDIRDEIKVSEKISFIFHTAAVTNSKMLIKQPIEAFETQVLGNLNVLHFAESVSAHVLYLSSMEVYGQPFTNGMATEDKLGFVDPLVVRNGYPEAKRANEFLSKAFSEEKNVFAVNARLAQTFGPGVKSDDSRVFAQFIRSAIKKEDLVLHTDGSSLGNYCYLRDVIEALLLLMIKGVSGESYNIVNEETNISIKEMAELVSKEFGNGKVQIVIPKESMGYAPKVALHLSSEKIRKLGWRPTYGLSEMFSRTIRSWE